MNILRNKYFWATMIAVAVIGGGAMFSKWYQERQFELWRLTHLRSFALYTVYHKEYPPILRGDAIIPIQAGRALKRDFGLALETEMIGDDTGDNISLKNERYAELTAMYWMWKNAPKVDYIGLMHYRRLFRNEFHERRCPSFDDVVCRLGLTPIYLDKLMYKYDIVVARRSFVGEAVYMHYKHAHYIKDLDLAIEYIKKHYPKMSISVDNALNFSYFYNANMFIMKKELYDEYAAWLFEILFAIEDKMSHDNEGYNKRAPGFLAERLFNVWLEYNHPKYRIGELHLMPR